MSGSALDMVSPEPIDPYLIPGTNVVRNRLGITSSDELSAAEADLSFARALQLVKEPVAATNDWAGQIRTIDVRKNIPGVDVSGSRAMRSSSSRS